MKKNLIRVCVLIFAVTVASCGGGSVVGLPLTARPPVVTTQSAITESLPLAHQMASPLMRAPLLSPDALFDWAEKKYPQYFTGAGQAGLAAPFQFRYYAVSKTYLAVADGGVYLLGPVSGGIVQRVADLVDFTCVVRACTGAIPVQRSSYDNKVTAAAVLGPQDFPRNVGFNNAYAFADFFQDGSYSLVSNSLIYSKTRDASLFGSISFYKMEGGVWVDRTARLLSDTSGCLHPRKATVADFNGDGKPDVFFSCHGYDFPGGLVGEQQRVLMSQPDGSYKNIVVPVTCFCHSASAVDFRGDGFADIVVTDNAIRYTPFFLKNQKNGTFSVDTSRLPGQPVDYLKFPDTLFSKSIFTAEFIDFSGNGRYDLFLAGNEPGTTGAQFAFVPQILKNNGLDTYFGTERIKLPVNTTYSFALDISFDGELIHLARTNIGSTPETYYTKAAIQEVNYATLASRTLYEHAGVFRNQQNFFQWINWIIPYQGKIVPMDRGYQQ